MADIQAQNNIEKIDNVEKVIETEKKKDDTYLKNGNHNSDTEQNDNSNVKGTENGNDKTDAKKEDGNNKKDLKENENVEETNKENKLSSTEEEKSTENQNDKNCDEDSLDNKLVICKELYSSGSRNFLLKNYQDAADMLGEACGLFEEIYGSESSELGMPLLLYAKSLIALSLEENKVLDVPDVEEEGDSDDQPEEEDSEEKPANDKKSESKSEENLNGDNKINESQVSSSSNLEKQEGEPSTSSENGSSNVVASTSHQENNAEKENIDEEEDTDATNLQIAWETLELSAKIFSKQGMSGLPNLAEIHTELGNIQFENEIFDAAREDYGKALKIYQELPIKENRRAQAEIHYKIGLTFLLQTMNKEGSEAFKAACDLLSDEVEDIKNKNELTDTDKSTIKDIEETQQDIMAKIAEIEETRQQVLDEVRAALDKYKSPTKQSTEVKQPSTSTDTSTPSSSKPNDISHLIKRKKPDTTTSPEVESSPAKRLNTEKTC